ncbi:MAG: hypothetical protein ACO1OX_05395 [Novosphingobium sp.]
MPRPICQNAAAVLSLLLAATLWLPTVDTGPASLALSSGPVMATYSLPLVA